MQGVKNLQSGENVMIPPPRAVHRRPIPRFPGFLIKSGFGFGSSGLGGETKHVPLMRNALDSVTF